MQSSTGLAILILGTASVGALLGCGGGNSGGTGGTLVDAGVTQCTPTNVDVGVVAAGDSPFNMDSTFGSLIIDTDKMQVFSTFNGMPVDYSKVKVQVVKQANTDLELLVFSASRILVAAGIQVTVVGSRPLVLASSGDVTIDGTIVSNGTVPDNVPGFAALPQWKGGAGGYEGGKPQDPTATGPAVPNLGLGKGPGGGKFVAGKPGGGAGHLTEGADNAVDMASGGSTSGNAQLSPLQGGPGGGAATGTGNDPKQYLCGGGGGGAVQVSAFGAVSLGATGGIDVNGKGACGANGGNGGGGGAGGVILVEACKSVSIAGKLFANGGGGGGGLLPQATATRVDRGQNGKSSEEPAQGGMVNMLDTSNPPVVVSMAASGGNGGAGKMPVPTPGVSFGGGGGSAGRIRLRSLAQSAAVSGVVSPSSPDGYTIANQ